jgi:hypothetical protein
VVAVTGIAILAVTAAAGLAGVGEFEAFPGVKLDAGPVTLALCAVVIGLSAIPFSVQRWRSRV